MAGLQYPGLYSMPPVVPVGVDPVVITTIALPTIVSGQPYSATILAAGGKPPYGFGLIAGTLPPGLFLSSAGVLSGVPVMPGIEITPTVLKVAVVDTPYAEKVSVVEGETRTYLFSVRVLDEVNQYDSQQYSLTVLDNQTLGSVTFGVEGCVPPCLSVGLDGTIGGIPMKVGTYPLTFVALDGSGALHARLNYTLIVRPKP